MLMQDKMDDMDCSSDTTNQQMMVNGSSFVPKTELDYLLLGCLLESQQISPTQNSPNTVRAFSMYQRQFENHRKKSQQGFRNSNNGNNIFAMPYPQTNMTSGQSSNGLNGSFTQPLYNNNNNSNGNIQTKMPFQNYNGGNQNVTSQQMNPKFSSSRGNGSYQQNVPPNNDLINLTNEKISKKEKKKPKRPNKVKPQGCEWCKVNSSPVWRGGPSGKGSLCNACGLQYMKGFTMERAKETLRKSRGDWKINSQM